MFSSLGAQDDADGSRKLLLVVTNALELMSRMAKLDKRFLKCLESASLAELKRRCSRLAGDMSKTLRDFEQTELPANALELLRAKDVCFSTLADALRLQEPDLQRLRGAKDVFERWELHTFVMAVNSMENLVVYHFQSGYH